MTVDGRTDSGTAKSHLVTRLPEARCLDRFRSMRVCQVPHPRLTLDLAQVGKSAKLEKFLSCAWCAASPAILTIATALPPSKARQPARRELPVDWVGTTWLDPKEASAWPAKLCDLTASVPVDSRAQLRRRPLVGAFVRFVDRQVDLASQADELLNRMSPSWAPMRQSGQRHSASSNRNRYVRSGRHASKR